jgi:hypothetical protein
MKNETGGVGVDECESAQGGKVPLGKNGHSPRSPQRVLTYLWYFLPNLLTLTT